MRKLILLFLVLLPVLALDVSITEINIPEKISTGENLHITLRVLNQGKNALSVKPQIKVLAFESLLDTLENEVHLSPGEEKDVNFVWRTVSRIPGRYELNIKLLSGNWSSPEFNQEVLIDGEEVGADEITQATVPLAIALGVSPFLVLAVILLQLIIYNRRSYQRLKELNEIHQ